LTNKSDVYSFGVVLLELLTRKKPFRLQGPEDEKSLAQRFISVMKDHKLEEILDDQNKNGESMEVVEEVAELAQRCLEMCGANRPSMREVSEMLGNLIRKVMQHPWAQQKPRKDAVLARRVILSKRRGCHHRKSEHREESCHEPRIGTWMMSSNLIVCDINLSIMSPTI
jgi:serine/threonine protein kinase